jgi:hypothetical protein
VAPDDGSGSVRSVRESTVGTGAAVEHLVPVRGVLASFRRHRDLRRRLERLQIRPTPTSSAPVVILVTVLVVAIAFGVVGGLMGGLSSEAAFTLVAVIVTTAGLLVAILQWRVGLSEKAFDALYGRIELGNRMRLNAFEGVAKPDDAGIGDDAHERKVADVHPELYKFFVYTEIDSFEYATRRYQSGLGLSVDIVDRALQHFTARCRESQTFRDVARRCIEGAYFKETQDAVRSILNDVERAEAPSSTER